MTSSIVSQTKKLPDYVHLCSCSAENLDSALSSWYWRGSVGVCSACSAPQCLPWNPRGLQWQDLHRDSHSIRSTFLTRNYSYYSDLKNKNSNTVTNTQTYLAYAFSRSGLQNSFCSSDFTKSSFPFLVGSLSSTTTSTHSPYCHNWKKNSSHVQSFTIKKIFLGWMHALSIKT